MGIRVASQLGSVFNDRIRARRPDLDLVDFPAGVPARMDGDVQAMIALPLRKAGQEEPPRPAGWPFGLRWIQLTSVGTDLYPDWLFDGPLVSCTRGATSDALAEFALAAIMAAAKDMPGIWIGDATDWKMRGIRSVRGKTLGLVGFGGIGQALAPLATALGMRIIASRRTASPLPPGIESAANVAELFAKSDHVVLAAPATPETNGMVSRAVLAGAKPGLHLVNIARGSLIDDTALLEALEDGRVALATLDVAHPEPLPAGHPFYTHPRVRLSPHIAVMTEEIGDTILDKLLANLALLERGEQPEDLVDMKRGY